MYRIGLDIGSTTIKSIVLDPNGKVLYSQYERHFSLISQKTREVISRLAALYPQPVQLCISGSAGMGLAAQLELPFAQEVYATREAVFRLLPDTDVVIELGGEDAKILFLSHGSDVCMNGSCAGGTGAFIDQMASLLGLEQEEMNALAASAEKIYPIASRCGVFAKSDIQPLLNQGADKKDISASIFQAVVNQTIAGLAHGRKIKGNVVYLGGPLTFFSQLRRSFDHTLKLTGTCPDLSLYYVAYGAALLARDRPVSLLQIRDRIGTLSHWEDYASLPPLFKTRQQLDDFRQAHPLWKDAKSRQEGETCADLAPVKLWVGIDAGSTTVKCAAIDSENNILFSDYRPNAGNPVAIVKKFLENLYVRYPNARIAASAATGYGEELIQAAFHTDFGVVETAAHYTAARTYDPLCDFILDIGGQDIKCFKIRNGAIDQIFLNEACSSGCGSFLQTFAGTLGYDMETFSRRAVQARKPVDLGSRCTVFMNSSVKQAQKDGASLEDIAAGLAVSVVKNALYKVIRLRQGESLGEHIIVQGGTFLNDAVLRAFEQELGKPVIRPAQAGIMGAYGAALYAREKQKAEKSSLVSREELAAFVHKTSASQCRGCTNQCRLTLNRFSDGKVYVAGNQCDRPLGMAAGKKAHNIWEYKREQLAKYGSRKGTRITLGLPLVLNFYELLPFWHTLLSELGFGIVISGPSTRKLYQKGQHAIASDTICYPAKLAHGHMLDLMEKGADAIFCPCLSYNLDEGKSDNHYNCPVVAYYPEIIQSTMELPVLSPYLGIHRSKDFPVRFAGWLGDALGIHIPIRQVKQAAAKAYGEYGRFMEQIRFTSDEWMKEAMAAGQPIVLLAGRPYHADPEVMHGIDRWIASTGALVLSEDSVGHHTARANTDVLNQWTYHARLYSAAGWVADSEYPDIHLVQLVSFGCGIDAITGDEVRAILEEKGKLYTQLKIDETTSLGAVKIRLRSLFAAAQGKESHE